MNRKELAAQIRSRANQNKRQTIVWLTILGLWMVAGALLDNLLNWFGSTFLRYAYGVLGFVLFVIFLLAVAVSQMGVPCPHCKKRLSGVAGQIAVATGNCGYCGEKAFES